MKAEKRKVRAIHTSSDRATALLRVFHHIVPSSVHPTLFTSHTPHAALVSHLISHLMLPKGRIDRTLIRARYRHRIVSLFAGRGTHVLVLALLFPLLR